MAGEPGLTIPCLFRRIGWPRFTHRPGGQTPLAILEHLHRIMPHRPCRLSDLTDEACQKPLDVRIDWRWRPAEVDLAVNEAPRPIRHHRVQVNVQAQSCTETLGERRETGHGTAHASH